MANVAIPMVISLAMTAISSALRPKPPKPQGQTRFTEGERSSEFSLAGGSAYGVAIPLLFGRARLPANLVWLSEVRESIITTNYVSNYQAQVPDGKKGSKTETISDVTVQKTYQYKADLVVQICQGPIDGGICKIFADKQLVYNAVAGENSVEFKYGSFTLYKGTESQALPSPVPTNYRGTVVVYFEDFDLTAFGNRLPVIEIEISDNGTVGETGIVTPAPVSAADVLESICQRAGMVTGDFYIAGITSEFLGYVTPQGPLLNALQPIIDTAKAVSIYSDDKIKFKGRAVDPVATIPAADLRYAEDGVSSDSAALLLNRTDEKTLPSKVVVSYADPLRDGDQNTQSASLRTPHFTNDVAVNLAVAMTADEAARLAEVYLYTAWQERVSYQLSLGPKYLFLEPGDVVIVQSVYGDLRMQILKIDAGANGVLSVEAVSYNRNTLISSRLGANNPVNNAGDPSVTDSTFQFFNAPLLLPTHNQPGVFLFANGATPALWDYSALYLSRDAVTYQYVGAVNNPGVFGVAITALPDHPAQLIDYGNYVDILLNGGQLASVTLAECIENQYINLFFIGDEMVQAVNVDLIAANTYRLSTLLRGRFGTEHYTSSHAGGEKVALAGSESYFPLSLSTDYNATIYFKLVSNGQLFGDVSTVHTVVSEFRTLKPYSPVNVDAVLNGADIVISWNRRSRFGDELPTTGAEVPLYEDSEAYEIDIVDAANALIRTLTATTTTVTYTAADQTADAYAGIVRCRVYQVSASLGRGTPSHLLVKSL